MIDSVLRIRPALLLVPAAALLVFNAWSGSLLGSDDAIYAQAAREVRQGGRTADVTWQGREYIDKGPVLFTLLAISQAALGETEMALRLPGILAALVLLACIYGTGRATGLGAAPAIIAAGFALALNCIFLNARRPMTDVPSVALAMLGFWLTAFGDGRKAAAGGVFLGLSALTKVTAPAPFILALLLVQVVPEWRRPGVLLRAGVAALVVALPWHLWMVVEHGGRFIDIYLGYNLLQRLSTPVAGGGGAYIDWLVERELPALAFAVPAVLAVAVGCVRRQRPPLVAALLLGCCLLPVLASATALPQYLVPLAPGAALAVGFMVERARSLSHGIGRLVPVVATASLAAVFAIDNGRDMLDPDYSAGTKEACAAMTEAGETARLAGTFDLYDPGVTWYCGTRISFHGIDEGYLGAVGAIPLFGDFVRRVDGPALREMANGRSILVTRTDREPALRALAAEAGVGVTTRTFGTRVVAELH